MKNRILILLAIICSGIGTLSAQNPEGFDEMVSKMVKGTVPYISAEALEGLEEKNLYILDTRESEEYEVGHLPKAIYVGYKDLEDAVLENIPMDATIVTYCSIGYRSEKIGLKLMAMGHQKVYNLKGGVFDWVNNGRLLEEGSQTVHGYNKKWSKWLNPERISVVTDAEELISD